MAVVTLEDLQGTLEVVVFPRTYETTLGMWRDGAILLVAGRVDHRGEEASLLADSVWDWDTVVERGPEAFGREVGAARAAWRRAAVRRRGRCRCRCERQRERIGEHGQAWQRSAGGGARRRGGVPAPRGGGRGAAGRGCRDTVPVAARGVAAAGRARGARPHLRGAARPRHRGRRGRRAARGVAAPRRGPRPGRVGRPGPVEARGGVARTPCSTCGSPATRDPSASSRRCRRSRRVLRERPGATRVVVHVPAPGGSALPMELRGVAYDAELVAEVRRRVGDGVIELQLG